MNMETITPHSFCDEYNQKLPLNIIHRYIETTKSISSVPLFCAACTNSVVFFPFCYCIANPE